MRPPDTAIAHRAAHHWAECINRYLDTLSPRPSTEEANRFDPHRTLETTMTPIDYFLAGAITALGVTLIALTPCLQRKYIVHTVTRRVETFFTRPCEETYLSARDFCERHCIQRAELPRGYYAKIVRMEEAIHALRALGRPMTEPTNNQTRTTP